MILSDVISLAKERLSKIYSNTEISSITLRLCEHYFGISNVDYYTSKDRDISNLEPFMLALEKLEQHCPTQYVIGETTFYGLRFKLNEHVLIPRPETEELVDWIIKDSRASKPSSILDIGTGSGAIAASLAQNIPSANIAAIDISSSAITVAQANALLNNVPVRFLKEDIFAPSDNLNNQTFDLIVSNPPYVRESEKTHMSLNVLSYEPALALFVADSNPLTYYQAIANFSTSHLSVHGSIYLEVNEELGRETAALFDQKIYVAELRKDINGKDRMLKLTKR